ncbi:hypothetical protein [Methylobacterium sp. sgz302541]|uniref:hypothetical protein n=1 Tax=unclassified Methylobacterium TaxID=2615210 RepID=UPI003D354A26
MPVFRTPDNAFFRRLHDRVVLSLALEESFLAVLSEGADQARLEGDEDEARRLAELVHGHRADTAERRALLGAAGIAI